jgi:hypothetical protein
MNLTAQSASGQNQQTKHLAFPQTPEPSKEQFGNTFFAQPYNLDAAGFYFSDLDDYNAKAEGLLDSFGCPVEEVEIMFIDGSGADAELFAAAGINQANLEQWFDDLEDLDEQEKAALFAILSLGYGLEQALEKIEDATLYRGRLEDAAEELFDEIYLSEIPENLHSYIDYSRFARDCELSGDMSEFEFAGETWTLTNASGL